MLELRTWELQRGDSDREWVQGLGVQGLWVYGVKFRGWVLLGFHVMDI